MPQSGHPTGAEPVTIDLLITRLDDLFNPLDPSRTEERDLAPAVVDYLTQRTAEAPRRGRLVLRVQMPNADAQAQNAAQRAIRRHFERSALASRRELKRHFLTALRLVATGFLAALILSAVARAIGESADSRFLQRVAVGLSVVVWVILWRPLETLIYDWRPIRRRCQINDRLEEIDIVSRAATAP